MSEFKITRKSHFIHIIPAIVLISIFPFLCYFFFLRGSLNASTILMLITVLLIQLIPQIALHLNYYFVNKGDVFIYDPVNKMGSLFHGSEKVTFYFDDILSFTLYKSFAINKNNSQYLVSDIYNHGIIKLKDGISLTLTSLLMGDEIMGRGIKLLVSQEKIIIKQNIYRWAKKSILRP